ncbi:hypothetical protein [Sansalvadorimonas verongulae]|uniref:hypothetical protein n=1 Tax=Sansalvadorimonas verongulae TaxID=2172824 RepID=UPI0012BB554C|nr:hypothetical protein [Sansalvadorimonas verongulae]MTI12708.1 hypothetical protein [Sansalvadorimonas verongulae]
MSFEITGERQLTYNQEENSPGIFIPIKLVRRAGRTHIQTSDGQVINPEPLQFDTALVKALAQAHIWMEQMTEGKYAGVSDLARRRKQITSYVSRIMRLTLLSPQLQEAILTGQNIGGRTLADFMDGFPLSWHEQERWINQ